MSLLIVGLYRSHGMLLLSFQIQCNLVQIEVLVIERISNQVTVVCAIIHQSDYDAGGKLTGKQLLVADVHVILRNGERFAYCASYGVFCVLHFAFQSLGVNEEDGGVSFTFRTNRDACMILTLLAAFIRQKESLLRTNLS